MIGFWILGFAFSVMVFITIRNIRTKNKARRVYESSRANQISRTASTSSPKRKTSNQSSNDGTSQEIWMSTLIVNESSFDHNTSDHGSNEFGGGSFGGGGAGGDYSGGDSGGGDAGGGD